MQYISLEKQKEIMLELHLRGRDIVDKKILRAMVEVPREEFIPERYQRFTYRDIPLLIGYGQTISQPYTVAYSIQSLGPKEYDIVLDIGTGSGYQAAVLSRICRMVITIERIPELAERARKTLKRLGYTNIEVVMGNGVLGYPRYAPYDEIVCAAATEILPVKWGEQLRDGGTIIYPKNAGVSQKLMRVTKKGNIFTEEMLGNFSFVPLVDQE